MASPQGPFTGSNVLDHPRKGGWVDSGGGPPQDGDMNERVARLEQRLDSVLPTLSTKADFGELRGDIHKASGDVKSELHKNHSDIQRWMIGTIIALFLGMVGWGTFLSNGLKSAASQVATQSPPQPIIIQIPAAAMTSYQNEQPKQSPPPEKTPTPQQ